MEVACEVEESVQDTMRYVPPVKSFKCSCSTLEFGVDKQVSCGDKVST